MSDGNHRVGREDCFICSRGNPDILERHHIVPKRFGGSDEDVNLVDLCPSCHRALESLYDERFWTAVGAVSEQRQFDFIIADLIERLENLEYDVTETLRTIQTELDSEYTDTNVDVAKASPRQQYLESIDPDSVTFTESSERQSETPVMDQVASFIKETSTDGYAPTVETVADTMSEGKLTEGDVYQAIEKLCQVGRAYYPDEEQAQIRVIDG